MSLNLSIYSTNLCKKLRIQYKNNIWNIAKYQWNKGREVSIPASLFITPPDVTLKSIPDTTSQLK